MVYVMLWWGDKYISIWSVSVCVCACMHARACTFVPVICVMQCVRACVGCGPCDVESVCWCVCVCVVGWC